MKCKIFTGQDSEQVQEKINKFLDEVAPRVDSITYTTSGGHGSVAIGSDITIADTAGSITHSVCLFYTEQVKMGALPQK